MHACSRYDKWTESSPDVVIFWSSPLPLSSECRQLYPQHKQTADEQRPPVAAAPEYVEEEEKLLLKTQETTNE